MRELAAARDQLLAGLNPLPTEKVDLSKAAGRVLAVAPVAQTGLPSFDNSAMDGFAIRAADVTSVPISLRVIGEVAAGGWFAGTVNAGEAVRLFTGAPLPAGADAVLMQEDASVDADASDRIVAREGVKPWENVRFCGEDVHQGDVLYPAGSPLGPAALGLLAAAGVNEVQVYRRPRVALLVTGSELVPPGSTLCPGQIFESNSLMLAELVRRAGADPCLQPPVADEPQWVRAALERGFSEADLVLTAGGASVGKHDLVRDMLEALGGSIELWRLAMKPGKPFFCGRFRDRPLLGVPGNPVSAFVTTVLLVLPALRRLQGFAEVLPPTTPGWLDEPLANPDSRRHFVRVVTRTPGRVRSAGVQASHRLASLAAADGLVEVPPRTQLPAGEAVDVIRW